MARKWQKYIYLFYTGLWETSKAFSHHNKSCITVFDLRLEVKNQDIWEFILIYYKS